MTGYGKDYFMTIGQSIQKRFFNDAPYHPELNLAKEIDAALEERTRQCAEICEPATYRYHCGLTLETSQLMSRLKEEILALNSPPNPIWCKPDCPNPWRWEKGLWKRGSHKMQTLSLEYGKMSQVMGDWEWTLAEDSKRILYCDACGAKRPEVNP